MAGGLADGAGDEKARECVFFFSLRFFLLPLWEKVARTKSATDEG